MYDLQYSFWTEERCSEVVRLIKQGWSDKIISDLIGCKMAELKTFYRAVGILTTSECRLFYGRAKAYRLSDGRLNTQYSRSRYTMYDKYMRICGIFDNIIYSESDDGLVINKPIQDYKEILYNEFGMKQETAAQYYSMWLYDRGYYDIRLTKSMTVEQNKRDTYLKRVEGYHTPDWLINKI